MSFLKSEPFKFNGHTVTLYELSALQRIEHLQYLAKEDQQLQKGADESELVPLLVASNIRSGAMLVAMSLWQADTSLDINSLHHEVLSGWPPEMIGAGEHFVKNLSDMIPQPETETENINGSEGDISAETEVGAEKYSPVS